MHIAAGGEIGPHPAGFGQLFLVVSGEAWVEGANGVRRPVRAGHGAVIARGEVHRKGSAAGCTAIMIQLAELTSTGTVDPLLAARLTFGEDRYLHRRG